MVFLQGGIVGLMPNPQPGGPGGELYLASTQRLGKNPVSIALRDCQCAQASQS